MKRISVELTPEEFAVFKKMIVTLLMDAQGNGSLSDDEDDALASLNFKLLREITSR